MKLNLIVSPGHRYVPATQDDREKARALQVGDILPVSIRKPRNGDHHRKFMALVGFVASHHPTFRKFSSAEPLLYFLKMETGHYVVFEKADGEVIRIPRGINYDDMDEGEFVAWSARARRILLDDLLPGFTERDKQRLAFEIDSWFAWT